MSRTHFLQKYPYDGRVATKLQAGFGLECELLSPDLVLQNCTPTFPVPANWAQLPLGERQQILTAEMAGVPFGQKPVLFRSPQGVELHLDDTGNLEWKIGPLADLEALFQEQNVLASLGQGSYQAMVSFPHEVFFNGPNALAENLGWLNFFQDYDILERAIEGLKRWQVSGQPPLKNFSHPYLGPMVEVRHRYLRKYLRENSEKNFFDEENLQLARVREQSFKYVGAVTYRPDIAGPDRICLEVRDAHRDLEKLRQRVLRILYFRNGLMTEFSRFADIPAFDSEKCFALFSAETQMWLRSVFARDIPARAEQYPKAKFVHEIFRNFSYPLRDWRQVLATLNCTGEIQRVLEAQEDFIERVSQIQKKNLSNSENRIFVQLYVCEFIERSGIFSFYQRQESAWMR